MNPMNPMANMNAMGGPVGGGPIPMGMNNGSLGPGQNSAQQKLDMEKNRTVLNTYIYDYFLREGMYDSARTMLNSEQTINVVKDSPGRQNGNGAGDDPMDTDSKDGLNSKRPDDLPMPNLPVLSDNCFLFEWFCLFWEMLSAQRNKNLVSATMNQYINHTQQQSRLKQTAQQDMLRQMRPGPDGSMPQVFNPAMMRNMPNGMQMNMKPNSLARTAMVNNQNNPQAIQMLQQQAAAKQNQMQRDPSDMDGNRRPASPGSTDNAPSPSKRQRVDGATPFNPQQGGMVPNGRPQQGIPGQQVGTQNTAAQQASHMLISNGINPANLSAQQFQIFQNQPPATQQKSIQAYSANLQQHQSQQMPGKQMQNPGVPQGHGSPMMTQGPNTTADISNFYNAGDMGAPGAMRPGPGNGQGGGSNHALQDYQMQLMLLEQQNKKRLMMARQEQDSMGGMPRTDGPGGPPGANGQAFPETSPQGVRPGASPNPSEQLKRTPQMTPANMPSPLPEAGGQSRGSPSNPLNFMPQNMEPGMAPHFFKGGVNGMEGANMGAVQMNGVMRPPSSHPGQPFNGQMNPQMMARQPGPGGPQMQWQGGPNGGNPMVPQGPQGQVQGTPQQRSMPPPSAPGPNNNNRTQPSSPAPSAAPPTPQQSNKTAPKKKDNKNAKGKGAANKKATANTGATPASDAAQEAEAAPQTPITPVNPTTFGKNGQAGGPQSMPSAQTTTAAAAPAAVAPQGQPDLSQGGFGMDNGNGMVDFVSLDFSANPLPNGDVLEAFDFDSFLHDGDGGDGAFDFNQNFMEGEIGAE